MNEINLDDFLKTSPTFSSLDAKARQRILPCFTEIELVAKEILFYQGDPSDSVYFLVSGKLSVELVNAAGETRIVGYIQPGEAVGEMGAFSDEPRTLTTKAVIGSYLIKLATKDFIAICHEYPSVMFAIMHPMVARTSNLIQALSTEKRNKHVVIVPANANVDMSALSMKLEEFADTYRTTSIMSDYQSDFSENDLTGSAVNDKIKQRGKSNKSTHRTLYILRAIDTPLAKVALKRANMIYITAEAFSEPTINVQLLEIIKNRHLGLVMPPSLILLYPDKTLLPNNTIQWLQLTEFGLYHHVRMDMQKDFQRLFRFIRGKAVGLVLGGGGTRGWAHIGAIKALQTSKIPIDIIGGTSVGALVAGIYAMHPSHEAVYEKFQQMVIQSKNTIAWRNLTWPIISLFNAKNYTSAQIELFQEQQIENLWLPYFCITSNLANCNEVIHQTGTLWEKIRASTAIPGLIPPMVLGDEVHIDGGLLNNLPVDAMRKLIGPRGKIIAIELNDLMPDDKKYYFSPIQTFTDIFLSKLRIKKSTEKFPRLVDTFLRGLFIGSLWRTRQNAIIANIFVSLNLTKYHILRSNPEEGKQLAKIGFDETLKQIEKTKNKNIVPG